jgi:hypothetical protein
MAALIVRQRLVQLGARVTEAFPREDGGVVVSGITGRDSVDVTCLPDGGLSVYAERDDEEFADFDRVSFAAVETVIGELGWKDRMSSGSFTQSTTLGSGSGSSARRFGYQTTDSQWWTRHVPAVEVIPRAPTYQLTTNSGYQATHQSFSASPSQNSRSIKRSLTPQMGMNATF